MTMLDQNRIDSTGPSVPRPTDPIPTYNPQHSRPYLEVAGELVPAGPVADEPRDGEAQVHEAEHQDELVHVRELLLALQRPALLGHHGAAHDGEEGGEPREPLHGERAAHWVGDGVVHDCGGGWRRYGRGVRVGVRSIGGSSGQRRVRGPCRVHDVRDGPSRFCGLIERWGGVWGHGSIESV